MEIKIGDRVRFNKHDDIRNRDVMRSGTVVDIRINDKYDIYTGKLSYTFYSVLDDRDNATISMGWSCNVFPHLGETIELDITRMRDEKLREIIKNEDRY